MEKNLDIQSSEGAERDHEADVAEGAALVAGEPLSLYLLEVSKYQLLSREEEFQLAVKYRENKDVQAAYKLVTANLRLVIKMAAEYHKTFANILDLIQEGNIGLMEAVKRFDPYYGVKFSSYASWWIRAYILKYILDNWSIVKIGKTRAQKKLFFNLKKEKEKLEQQGINPGPKLLAERLGVKEEDVIDMDQRMGAWEVSLDRPIRADSDERLLEFLQAADARPEEQLAQDEFKRLLKDKVAEFSKTLNEKELIILSERVLADKPLTLQEIGQKIGLTRERARQIEKRTIQKLRQYLRQEMKDSF